MKELPVRMADPDIQPAMNQLIQRACQDFPKAAQIIIANHGFKTEDFNKLQEKVEKNFFFRYKVQREIKHLERKEKMVDLE